MFVEASGKLFRFIEHNQGLFVAVGVALLLAGCESFMPVQAPSPLTGQPATIDDLQQQLDAMYIQRDRELSTLQQQAQVAVAAVAAYGVETSALEQQFQNASDAIAQKREQRYALLKTIGSLAQDAGVPWLNMAIPLLLTGGAVWDNRRKDLTIRSLKQSNGAST